MYWTCSDPGRVPRPRAPNTGNHGLAKAERQQARREEQKWSRTSLSLAMRGMEDENGPEYAAEDLEERFSKS